MNKKNRKLINNTVLFLIGNIGSKLIQFILVPLYTYTLTAEQYGTIDLFFTTISFLMPVFSFQVSDGLLRFGLSRNIETNDAIASSFRVLLVGSLLSVASIPIVKCIPSLGDFAIMFFIILNLQMYRELLLISLKVKDLNARYAINSIIYTALLCVLSVVFLAILKLGVIGYFLSYIIASIVSIVILVISSSIRIKTFLNNKKTLDKKIFLYSLPLVVNSISYWITMASDRYMIGAMLSVADIGIYAIACKMPSIITTFSGIFNQAWMISSINEYEDNKKSSYYRKTFENYYGITVIIISITILFFRPFMTLYVSPEYYVAWKYSVILILATLFSGICAFINGIFYAYKKNINITVTTVIGSLINIGLNLLLIPCFGVLGASIATLVSWVIISIARVLSIKKVTVFDINIKQTLFTSLAVTIEVAALEMLPLYQAIIVNLLLVTVIMVIEKQIIVRIFRMTRKQSRKRFDRRNKKRLINDDFTILCSNCTAGVIYHNLGLRFMTPTINMYFSPSDFIKLCSNLEYYLDCEMKEVGAGEEYPVAKIGDIVAHGVHYNSFAEMKKKWEERKKRINRNNIFIMMTERDGCSYEDLVKFDSLKYCNKIVFTHKKYEDIKSSYYIKGTNNNDCYNKTRALTDYRHIFSGFRFIDSFDYTEWFNKGKGEKK